VPEGLANLGPCPAEVTVAGALGLKPVDTEVLVGGVCLAAETTVGETTAVGVPGLTGPGLTADVTAVGAPGLTVDVTAVGAPGLTGLADVTAVGAPGLTADITVVGAPGLTGLADVTAVSAPGLTADVTAVGAPGLNGPTDVMAVGAPGLTALLGPADVMVTGVQNLCLVPTAVVGMLALTADVLGVDVLGRVVEGVQLLGPEVYDVLAVEVESSDGRVCALDVLILRDAEIVVVVDKTVLLAGRDGGDANLNPDAAATLGELVLKPVCVDVADMLGLGVLDGAANLCADVVAALG